MSFMSSLKRVQAAVSTGGASLLAPVAVQEKIGTGIFAGGALAALGSFAGVLGAGGSVGAAASSAGTTGLSAGTIGSQLLAKGVTGLQGLVSGIGTKSAPPSGGQPMDAIGGGRFMTTGLTPGGGLTDVAFDPSSGGFIPTAAGGGMIGRGFGTLSRIAGNLIMSASGRIRGLMTAGGQFLTARRVFSGVKILGIAGASAALGVSIDQIAQVVLQEATRRRRGRRGISAADLKRTRSTVRKITRMHHDLAQLCGQAGMSRRRAFPRAIAPHAHAIVSR